MAFPTTKNNLPADQDAAEQITSAHARAVDVDINALTDKVGIGAGTPTNGTVLTGGASAGSSSWETLAAGFTNPMTTLGDLIRGAASGVAERLGIGSAGQVLTVVSGMPAWATPSAGDGTATELEATQTGTALAPGPEIFPIKLYSSDSAAAPFGATISNTPSNGHASAAMGFGYNPDLADTDEPAFFFAIESNYAPDAPAEGQMECYYQWYSEDRDISTRPFGFVLDRTATTIDTVLTEFVFKSTLVKFNRPSDDFSFMIGQVHSTGVKIDVQTPSDITNGITNFNFKTTAANQTSTLVLQSNNNENAFAVVTDVYGTPAIHAGSYSGGARQVMMFTGNATQMGVSIGGNNSYPNGVALLYLKTPSDQGAYPSLVVQHRATPSASLVEMWDSAGTVLSRFNKAGYFMTRKVAAPADGDLVASEMALWLDDTNGAAKLMIKAKSANGTVATAAVALA